MKRQRGFSLIEMMVAVTIFVIITGAAFSLLDDSQRRYTSEAQLLDSFQAARFGYDQMSLDIHSAGFPPQNAFTAGVTPANASGICLWRSRSALRGPMRHHARAI